MTEPASVGSPCNGHPANPDDCLVYAEGDDAFADASQRGVTVEVLLPQPVITAWRALGLRRLSCQYLNSGHHSLSIM